ncbi:hypothetical protein [Methylobacterium sp. B4]|uniref:hypothetical protein n=1 Tax=Methylobacterium sp. B4 TaxID=1938755 RepID=UPI001FDFDABB|nr:hypothetical protein [Methylobacterium sp. B4]
MQDDGDALLAMILHAAPSARDAARERGRLRIERATMLPEAAAPAPPEKPRSLKPAEITPVN